jgi:hypothetical protein
MHSRAHRLLKPRSPDDCPACRLASTASSGVEPASAPVRPWREVKSRRGAPKRVNTEGFACPNRTCPYSGITDADIHASFRGWQAWQGRAHPNVSLPGLPHHLQCPAQHALVSFENSFPRRSPWCCQCWPKGWIPRLQSVCSAFDTPPSPPGCPELASTHKPCTSGPFAISTSRTSNWTNCEPGSAALHRCSGSGWLSTLAPRFFPCLSSVPAPNTWLIGSSIPCDRSWLPVASPSLPVTGSISPSMRSRPILGHGEKRDVEGARCAGGR